SFICEDILLAFSEIDILCAVFLDEVIVLFPVIFIIVECKAKLFLYAHHCCKLEEMSLMLMSSRLSDSDKSAAVVDEFLHSRHDRLVCPVVSSGVSCISITHIEEDINIVQ